MFRPATLILLALAALVGAVFGVREYAPQYLPDSFTTDAVLRERFREYIAEEDAGAAAFFDKFERLFPADHDALMTELVALYRRGGSEQQARLFGDTYMTSFVEDNKSYIAQAEPAALTALATAFVEGLHTLRQDDPAGCAQSIRGGLVPGQEVGGSDRSKAAMTNIAVVMLDTIASGRSHATQYAPPSEAQMRAWFDRYLSLGGDRAVLESLGNDARLAAVEPHALCQAGEILWTAALQAEDDFVPRFVSVGISQ